MAYAKFRTFFAQSRTFFCPKSPLFCPKLALGRVRLGKVKVGPTAGARRAPMQGPKEKKNDLRAMKQILYDMGPLSDGLSRELLKVWHTLRTKIQAEKGTPTQKLKKKISVS